jgi:hypothetical protein
MDDSTQSGTPLTATFTLTVDGKPLVIRTVGSALSFMSKDNCVGELTEHRGAYTAAKNALERAAADAILAQAATDALRVLLARSRLL